MEKEIINLRRKLDKINENLIDLLSERKEIVLRLVKIKRKNKLLIEDKKREKRMLNKAEKMAKEKGINPILVKKIIKFLIEDARKIQKKSG